MAFDPNGNYTLPSGTNATYKESPLRSSKWNAAFNDIAAALTQCLPRNSGSVAAMQRDLPMGGFRITGLSRGSASAAALSFDGDAGTGMWSPGAGQIAFSSAGVQSLSISANRNVTIAAPVSGHALTAYGSINATGGLFTNGTPLGTLATQNANAVTITGGSIAGITPLAIADGGTGASTAMGARTNLGLGTIATQNANAVAITGGSITGITPLAIASGGTGAATAADARTNLGLGTAATQNIGTSGANVPLLNAANTWSAVQTMNAVSITGGSISGITPLAIADGGTGASTAADARTNLGLGTAAVRNIGTSGSNVPVLDAANTWSAAQTFSGAVNANGGFFLDGNQLAISSPTEARDGLDNTKIITPLRLRNGLNAPGSAPVYACRAWVNFNGITGAIRAAGNVSSITRHGLGDYTMSFTTALPDADYAVSGITTQVFHNDNRASILIHGTDTGATTKTTTALRMGVARPHVTAAPYDSAEISVLIFR